MLSFEIGKCQSIKIKVAQTQYSAWTSAREIFKTIQLLSSSIWNHLVIFRWYLDDIWMILMWYSCDTRVIFRFQLENSLKEFISDGRIQNPTRSFTTNCQYFLRLAWNSYLLPTFQGMIGVLTLLHINLGIMQVSHGYRISEYRIDINGKQCLNKVQN